jgi:hypothetical protein
MDNIGRHVERHILSVVVNVIDELTRGPELRVLDGDVPNGLGEGGREAEEFLPLLRYSDDLLP